MITIKALMTENNILKQKIREYNSKLLKTNSKLVEVLEEKIRMNDCAIENIDLKVKIQNLEKELNIYRKVSLRKLFLNAILMPIINKFKRN